MNPIRAWINLLANGFRRERMERELDAELRAHVRLHIDDNLRAGMRHLRHMGR